MPDFLAGFATAPDDFTDPNSLEEWWKRRRGLAANTASVDAEYQARDRNKKREATAQCGNPGEGLAKPGRGEKPASGAVGAAGSGFSAPVARAASRARSAGAARDNQMAGVAQQAAESAQAAQAHSQDPIGRKTGLAGGSQAAVVKLASYASGGTRLGALGQYLSREGTIELETENGTHLAGAEAVTALAERWAEAATARRPSADILMMRLEHVPASSQTDIAAGLGESLAGHKYAWRAEEASDGWRVDVVMTAASSARDENGKAVRVYDNPKSLGNLGARLVERFGEGTTFEERGFAHGVEGAARYMARLTKGGQGEAQLWNGRSVRGHEANLQVAKDWKREMRSREQRDVAHIILSAKPGTDKEAFVDAARATLQKSFGDREYVFALHEDRNHLHVHAMLRLTNRDGVKLDPKVQDFKAWRQTFAEEARERNIQMEATSRFETANPPGYTLKDIRSVERGTATENSRRRVEAVRTRAVHLPTRPEGIEKARAVAGEWRQVSLVPTAGQGQGGLRAQDPAPAPDGMQRLYRFERAGAAATAKPIFTADRGTAEKLAAKGAGQLVYIDVAKDRLGELTPSHKNPGRDYVVTPAMASEAKPHGGQDESKVLHFRQRAEQALAVAGEGQERGPGVPPPADGMQRLYRFERAGAPATAKPIFTADRRAAEKLAAKGAGQLVYLDIAKDNLAELTPSHQNPGRDYLVTPAMAREAKPYRPLEDEKPLSQRAEEQPAPAGEQQQRRRPDDGKAISEGPTEMPYAQNMVEGREEIVKHLEQLEKAAARLPEEGQAEFRKYTTEYLENWDKGIQAARERESKIGQIEGEGYIEPKPREYENFTAYQTQQRGEAIVYAHKREDGAAGKTAFVDTGNDIKVENWRDRESNLAALQLASEKWDSIKVNGPERYQIATVKLAAEYGFKISNPEWQELYQQERERHAQKMAERAGLAAGERQTGERPENAPQQKDGAQQAPQESQAPITNQAPVPPVAQQPQGPAQERQTPDAREGTERGEPLDPRVQRFERFKQDAASGALKGEEAEKAGLSALRDIIDYERSLGNSQAPAAGTPETVPLQGEAERQASLNMIRSQVDTEATRETIQANEAQRRHETPGDPGYVSQSQAESARQAEETVDSNPKQQMTVTPSTSPEMERLAQRQQTVLREGEVARHEQHEKQEEQNHAQADKSADQQRQTPRERPRGQRQ